jgi:hypothetical protein
MFIPLTCRSFVTPERLSAHFAVAARAVRVVGVAERGPQPHPVQRTGSRLRFQRASVRAGRSGRHLAREIEHAKRRTGNRAKLALVPRFSAASLTRHMFGNSQTRLPRAGRCRTRRWPPMVVLCRARGRSRTRRGPTPPATAGAARRKRSPQPGRRCSALGTPTGIGVAFISLPPPRAREPSCAAQVKAGHEPQK